jgi:carbon-monoxide dehydrogenase large subunit
MTVLTHAGATRYSGRRINRIEDVRLLTGRGTYVDDVNLPGTLHACFARSPYPRARIVGIDVSAALELPGVRAVFLGRDLNADAHLHGHDGMPPPPPPLTEDVARFVGDPVALVIADNRYIAEDAVDLIDVDYDVLEPVVDYLTAEASTELVHDGWGSNLIGGLTLPPEPIPQFAQAFGSAAHVVSGSVYQQAQAACPMETRGIVVHHNPSSGEVTIYAATQAPHVWRSECANLLGIPEHRVRVIMKDTGGGFGQKILVMREDMAMMLASRKIDAPIKWIEDRRENLMAAGMSRHESGELTLSFDADGHLLTTKLDYIEDDGAYPFPFPVPITFMAASMFAGPYRIQLGEFRSRCIHTNTVGRTAYRGPWLFESLVREVVMDKAAREMGIDPVELRRRNMLTLADMPFTNPMGMQLDFLDPLKAFEAAIAQLDYEGFRRWQAEARAEGRLVGVGTCSYVEPTTPGHGNYGTEAATIRIEPSGHVNVYMAGGSSGSSLETTVAQLAADALDIDIDDVTIVQGDTALAGYGAGTGGSRSGSMTAGAVSVTAEVLRERIVAIVAHRLECSPDDVQLEGGRAFVRGTPTQGMTYAEVADLAYNQTDLLPPGVPPGLEHTGRYKAAVGWNWANATHICTCEVDRETGEVTLLRYIVGEDCGPMINPNVVEGQIAGGTVQGIAGSLFEEIAYDDDGNPLATSFMDYVVPTAAEVPDMEFVHVETPSPVPGGYKGVGEGGCIGSVGAVVNAVADALAPLGATVNRLPLGPSRILDLIVEAEAASADGGRS